MQHNITRVSALSLMVAHAFCSSSAVKEGVHLVQLVYLLTTCALALPCTVV